jgi:hypothetical protein
VAIGNSFVSKGYAYKTPLKRYLYTSLYASYYFFFKTRRLEQNEYFCANPDFELSCDIWNLLENSYLKTVLKNFMVDIRTNKKVYIPKVESNEFFTQEMIEFIPSFSNEQR